MAATKPAVNAKSGADTTIGAKVVKSRPAARKSRRRVPPRPAALPHSYYPVKFLENGFVSIVKRNATQSPLLRLPAELRNRIFELAMGGSSIRIQNRNCSWSNIGPKWKRTSDSVLHGRVDSLVLRKDSQGTAFHLPEVCRQVYSETATLGYATNSFVMGVDVLPERSKNKFLQYNTVSAWQKSLVKAQVDAIVSIDLDGSALETYMEDSKRLTQLYPSLKTLYLNPALSMGYLVLGRRLRASDSEWLCNKIKDKEGGQLVIKTFRLTLW